jgi:hypothetical protein
MQVVIAYRAAYTDQSTSANPNNHTNDPNHRISLDISAPPKTVGYLTFRVVVGARTGELSESVVSIPTTVDT